MAAKILIADDESRIRKLVSDYMTKEGYEVAQASDGQEALDKFYAEKPDIVILDVMMPEYNGYEVCEEIRDTSDTPIIILTAKDTEKDELNGFSKGADEYISKPFSPKILVARVNALLRRSNVIGEETMLEAGEIMVDINAHTVTVHGKNLELSVKEFELLCFFINNQGIALSREKILDNVWDYDYFGDARTVDTHVKKLRAKLKDYGKYIHTIWGMGYKFEVEK
ncbi:MAG: response regulator transcription factor [Lachnospiraceae bacterium]|nr:response regulator transcription factor [Lachnospiraceae bacterium]